MGMPRWLLAGVVVLASCPSTTPPATSPPPPPPPGPPFATPPPPGPVGAQSPICEQRDCPTTAPLYPTEDCGDGVHIGGRGPCVRFADGTCNWSGLVCAAAGAPPCAATDCGLPVPAVWTCPDGSLGAFTCVRAANGACGATYRPCPHVAPPPPVVVAPPPPPPPRKPHPCTPLPSDRELAKWPIGEICQNGGGPAQPDRTFIKTLADGTQIIEELGRCLRVRQVQCYTKCLPPDARIATPGGDVAIADLRVGDEIWTRDARGARVAGPVAKVSRAEIRGVHHVARLRLSDGRALVVSPEHPALTGRIQDLRTGDVYDGATILTLQIVRYAGEATYDLLPAGGAAYWADGVPLRSTLAN